MSKKQRYLSPMEYARLYGVHINSVMKWIRLGWIPSIRYLAGQRWRYRIPANAPRPRRNPGPPPRFDTVMRRKSVGLKRAVSNLQKWVLRLQISHTNPPKNR